MILPNQSAPTYKDNKTCKCRASINHHLFFEKALFCFSFTTSSGDGEQKLKGVMFIELKLFISFTMFCFTGLLAVFVLADACVELHKAKANIEGLAVKGGLLSNVLDCCLSKSFF